MVFTRVHVVFTSKSLQKSFREHVFLWGLWPGAGESHLRFEGQGHHLHELFLGLLDPLSRLVIAVDIEHMRVLSSFHALSERTPFRPWLRLSVF